MNAFHEQRTRILLLGVTVLSACTLVPAASAQDAERHKRSGQRTPHVGLAAGPSTSHATPVRSKSSVAPPQSKSEDISVTGSNSVLTAEKRLRKIPGNFTIISSKEVEKGRSATLEDTLAFQPGIFAQATSGSTGNKISIRGSGAGVFYGGYSLGMKYFIDGLTVSGVGGFQEDRLNNTGFQRTEALYGANAFDYAATALGGAINFVTHTGGLPPGSWLVSKLAAMAR